MLTWVPTLANGLYLFIWSIRSGLERLCPIISSWHLQDPSVNHETKWNLFWNYSLPLQVPQDLYNFHLDDGSCLQKYLFASGRDPFQFLHNVAIKVILYKNLQGLNPFIGWISWRKWLNLVYAFLLTLLLPAFPMESPLLSLWTLNFQPKKLLEYLLNISSFRTYAFSHLFG